MLDKLKTINVKGDSMEAYESLGQEIIEAEKSQADNQINGLLDQLDYRGQQEIAYGWVSYSNLKPLKLKKTRWLREKSLVFWFCARN